MWEIEGIIEDSIRFVSESEKSNSDKINLIYNLYQVQNQFDCSFTHFRLMDILQSVGYTKTITLEEHPDYKKNKTFFDELKKKDFEFIYNDVTKGWGKDNLLVGYWNLKDQKIFLDYDSPLWANDKKTILKNLFFYDLAKEIIEMAHHQKNENLVYDWTAFMLNYGVPFFSPELEDEKMITKYIAPIKIIFDSYSYDAYEPIHESLTVEMPPIEWADEKTIQLYEYFNS